VLAVCFEKWSAEERPIERGPPRGYPRGSFTATPRPGFFVDKHTVLAARNDPRVVVINALGPQFHNGLEPSRYGRPGRIPGSVNVPAATLYDPATKTFASPDDAERQFAAQGVTRDRSSPIAGAAFQPRPSRRVEAIFSSLSAAVLLGL